MPRIHRPQEAVAVTEERQLTFNPDALVAIRHPVEHDRVN
jgi:hypothetical protein